MEETYRIQNLVLKYIPSLIRLFGSSFKWSEEDRKFDKKLKIREKCLERQKATSVQIRTSLYDMLIEAENGNNFALKFIKFIDTLISEVVKILPNFKDNIRKNIQGTINNLDDWNYLNPIGELACLKKLLDSKRYILEEIECSFENGKTKDFLFSETSKNSQVMVEVLNIHSRFEVNGEFLDIKKHLFDKIIEKVNSETVNIYSNKYSNSLLFIPVVWHIKKESMQEYYEFFKKFNDSLGKELGLDYAICGFCSYLIINDVFDLEKLVL